MQSGYPPAFERDMACTEAEWLRWLAPSVGEHPCEVNGQSATVRLPDGLLHLRWHAGEPRTIALMRLPRLHVNFRFEGACAGERAAFMRRFDLYLQRGGG